jgi:hypothetical protein
MTTSTWSTYFRDMWFSYIKGTSTPTSPPDLFPRFYSVTTDRTGIGGTEITTSIVSSTLSIASSGWSTISNTGTSLIISNASDINYGNALASLTVTNTGIWDSATSGNYYANVVTPFTTTAGQPVIIYAGQLALEFDITNFSTFFGTKILNWIKGTASGTPPASLWLDQIVGDPTAGGTGGSSVATTLRGGRYQLANTIWTAITASGSDRVIKNTASQALGNAAASTSWTFSGLYDASTSGNHYWRGASAFTSVSGTPLAIAANALELVAK